MQADEAGDAVGALERATSDLTSRFANPIRLHLGLPEPRARSYGPRDGGIHTQRIWLHAPVAFATRDDDPLGR